MQYHRLYNTLHTAIALTLAAGIIVVGTYSTVLAAERIKVVVFGDSLVAGYQLPQGAGFVGKMQAALDQMNVSVELVGAGVSGDTSTGGLARLDWSVAKGTRAVILELGANDALRGIAPKITRRNLSKMIENLQARDVSVFLIGMRAPPNMGEDFQTEFDAIYADLAKKYELSLYPFFLDGVAANPALNLGDGMHPNKKGIDVIVERISPALLKFLKGLED